MPLGCVSVEGRGGCLWHGGAGGRRSVPGKPCRLSWGSSVQCLCKARGSPWIASLLPRVCQARGAWRWQRAGKAGTRFAAHGGTPAAAHPAGFGEGMAVCSVWVLACCDLSGLWGSSGQGDLICSLKIKPQKSLDGTGVWHCKPCDSLCLSNE